MNETDILFSIGNANLCRAPLGPDTRGDAKFRQGFLQGFFIEAPFRQLALGSKGHQSCPDAVMRHLFLFQRDVFRIGQDQMRRLAEGPIGQQRIPPLAQALAFPEQQHRLIQITGTRLVHIVHNGGAATIPDKGRIIGIAVFQHGEPRCPDRLIG